MHDNLPERSLEARNIVPGRYRHYGGGEYDVIGVAWLEASMEEAVVYRAAVDGTLWVRPVKDFLAEVEKDGYKGPRFVKVNT
jgi:hypothetical protein